MKYLRRVYIKTNIGCQKKVSMVKEMCFFHFLMVRGYMHVK